jgi:ferrous iron transport protein B
MEATSAVPREHELVIALAGNPNAGKTSLFNAITGARQHVGNWPGVTVEKKVGHCDYEETTLQVIDLPGTYSLGAFSEDEAIARDFIIRGGAEVVIDVVDASNLERNLYLTTQLLEMGATVVLALNMIDETKAKKIDIDEKKLSSLLGVPVVPTVATSNEGVQELLAQATSAARNPRQEPLKVDYGSELEEEIDKIVEVISSAELQQLSAQSERWLAVKLLEGDENVWSDVMKLGASDILTQVEKSAEHVREVTGEDTETMVADRRYGFISGLIRQCVSQQRTVEERVSVSDRIDSVVTNRFLGIPIFLFAMWAMFQFTFQASAPLMGWVEAFFGWLGSTVTGALAGMGASPFILSFVSDGLIGGLGSVAMFIPPIFTLFFAIALLEDSGYMARAAYVMDRFMQFLGLHGKAFVPMVIGFGCNVPAVMATRTLESKRDRLITILINPLMSCAARLPVYVLFAGAFFAEQQGTVVFSLYLLGIILAVIAAKVFDTFLFEGEGSPFVMELPPYRLPTLKSVAIHMWERGYAFIRKAGTVIFSVVVLIWLLATLPVGVEYASEASMIGRIGSLFAPIFEPAGFGNWQASVALIFGVLAKEVVVGTLGVVYGVGDAGLTAAIQQFWTPLTAYAYMVMTLVYIPCVAVIGAIRRGTNSWGWTAFSIGYSLALGWLLAVLIYQVGSLLM